MSAAIAFLPAHPLLSASLLNQIGDARNTLRATIERYGGAVLLYAGGEVDAANESSWRALLDEAAAATAAPGPLLIDTDAMDFMAGCAYAALAEQADRCRIRGITLCLVSAQRIVARVVSAMNLDDQLPLYHDVGAALTATTPIRQGQR
jgi:anti-anti-sigma factor